MYGRTWLILAISLLMFPQIAETMYSPALADIGHAFSVPAEIAAQTLSVYFVGFAVGVAVWGRVCDLLGRRPALLSGLLMYGAGCAIALVTREFSVLLAARVLAAFGAAVGSVVTQTVFRDRYAGAELAHVFSIAGSALAISPAVGMFLGSLLVRQAGHGAVFAALVALAVLLCAWSWKGMPETRPPSLSVSPWLETLRRMAKDQKIWCAAIIVACLNIGLFSYYSLAPFMFQRMGWDTVHFGLTGILLSAGSFVGAQLNRWLLKRGVSPSKLLTRGACMNALAAAAVCFSLGHVGFLLPMTCVAMAFAMLIPLVLGSALSDYGDCRGTAGAILGLLYYLLVGAGLSLAGKQQNLGVVLALCAAISLYMVLIYARKHAPG
jgi:Bcr/CflA subfamily drug resistance transporter